MSYELASIVKRRIPNLRRYAYALFGSEERGDECVAACLRLVFSKPELISGKDAKLCLFRAFHDANRGMHSSWRRVTLDVSDSTDRLIEGQLTELSVRHRQVLLLHALENFSIPELAFVLASGEDEVRMSLAEAKEIMRRRVQGQILIIEDDPIIALNLVHLVEDMGHWVCGTAARRQEAIDLAQESKPTIILADVVLEGGDNGIVAAMEIVRNMSAQVIFVTAYPESLEPYESVDPELIIPKPFDAEILHATIGNALSRPPRDHFIASPSA